MCQRVAAAAINSESNYGQLRIGISLLKVMNGHQTLTKRHVAFKEAPRWPLPSAAEKFTGSSIGNLHVKVLVCRMPCVGRATGRGGAPLH